MPGMNVLGLCGSLREGSFNARLMASAGRRLEAAGVTFSTHPLGDIPLYNGDLDGEDKPAAVEALRGAIDAADALLIVSPEYNYSVPGVLKNALDWVSRPAFQSVLKDRPTALLSASMSTIGGARMQAHLRNVLAGTLTPVYGAPEFLLATAQQAFDENGELADGNTADRLDAYLRGFAEWAGHR
jgi:chromate reductase